MAIVHFIPRLPPLSAVNTVFQADFGTSSPTAALTLADLLGMADVLTLFAFPELVFAGLFGTRTKIIPRPYAIPSAESIR